MKVKPYLLVAILTVSILQPASAKCVKLFPYYLKNPRQATAPGMELSNCQLALVKIVAVHPDDKPRAPWQETGTLELRKVESNGKFLPKTFAVPYQRRTGLIDDCETWDDVAPRQGERLLAFFRPENKGWIIPELASMDIVFDVDEMRPAFRKQVQPLFRTRL